MTNEQEVTYRELLLLLAKLRVEVRDDKTPVELNLKHRVLMGRNIDEVSDFVAACIGDGDPLDVKIKRDKYFR